MEDFCDITPICGEIHVYEATTWNDVDTDPDEQLLITSINTNLVKIVESCEDGYFETELEPGTYSLLILEKGKLYGNMTNGNGVIEPVEIKQDSVSEVFLQMTYQATFQIFYINHPMLKPNPIT